MQAIQPAEMHERTLTISAPVVGVASQSPSLLRNNYHIGGRSGVAGEGSGSSASRVAGILPLRVVSAFSGRIRLQTSGRRCSSAGPLRELAARLALLPAVRNTEVVGDANSVIVHYATQERDLAAMLRDIEAMTAAAAPAASGGRVSVPASWQHRRRCPAAAPPPPGGDLCTLLRSVLKRLPAYLRLGWALAKEPTISWRHKTLLYLFPVYQVSPIHLIVHAVPVLGLLDDAILFLLGARQALAHCPPPVAARHYSRLHLAPGQLEEDLEAVLKVVRGVISRVFRARRRRRCRDAKVAATCHVPGNISGRLRGYSLLSAA